MPRPLRALSLALLVALLQLGPGCGRGGSSSSAPAVSASARLEAQSLFAARCAGCHGLQGRGDGPNGQKLSPRPRDFSDAEWQRSVGDEQLRGIIVRGGRVSGKSGFMPAFPDLEGKRELLDAVVRTVRGFESK